MTIHWKGGSEPNLEPVDSHLFLWTSLYIAQKHDEISYRYDCLLQTLIYLTPVQGIRSGSRSAVSDYRQYSGNVCPTNIGGAGDSIGILRTRCAVFHAASAGAAVHRARCSRSTAVSMGLEYVWKIVCAINASHADVAQPAIARLAMLMAWRRRGLVVRDQQLPPEPRLPIVWHDQILLES